MSDRQFKKVEGTLYSSNQFTRVAYLEAQRGESQPYTDNERHSQPRINKLGFYPNAFSKPILLTTHKNSTQLKIIKNGFLKDQTIQLKEPADHILRLVAL